MSLSDDAVTFEAYRLLRQRHHLLKNRQEKRELRIFRDHNYTTYRDYPNPHTLTEQEAARELGIYRLDRRLHES